MIYLRARLYGEGASDDAFLPPLIERALYELAATEFSGAFEIDGGNDPGGQRRALVDPGIARAEPAVVAVGCVPVREVEAWLLADEGVFRKLFGPSAKVTLPRHPERETDPKKTLTETFKQLAYPGAVNEAYAYFGRNVSLDALRRLEAYAGFEVELRDAIRRVARAQGYVHDAT